MSSFMATARNKQTGEICNVLCIDDHFGRREYGYKVNGKSNIMREKDYIVQYEMVLDDENNTNNS